MNPQLARRVLSICSILTVFALSQPVRAESVRVLFVAHEQTPFSARIRAEIESMDFQVVLADTLPADDGALASAAARVIESPPPRRVELWLRSESTGQLALNRVLEAEQGEYGASAPDATAAVRVSEQLRAFFQPLREHAAAIELMPPRPPPPPLTARVAPRPVAPAPAPAGAVSPPDEGRIFQELAAAVPLEPGSLGLDVLLRARYRFGATYGLAEAPL